jgi:hypothetical protein
VSAVAARNNVPTDPRAKTNHSPSRVQHTSDKQTVERCGLEIIYTR